MYELLFLSVFVLLTGYVFFSKSAFSEYSCALDERLAGDSDGRREKLLCEDLRAPFSLQTAKYSALYVLIEVAAADATFDGTFSAFIKTIFYVGWSEGISNRQHDHQSSKYELH